MQKTNVPYIEVLISLSCCASKPRPSDPIHAIWQTWAAWQPAVCSMEVLAPWKLVFSSLTSFAPNATWYFSAIMEDRGVPAVDIKGLCCAVKTYLPPGPSTSNTGTQILLWSHSKTIITGWFRCWKRVYVHSKVRRKAFVCVLPCNHHLFKVNCFQAQLAELAERISFTFLSRWKLF